MSFERGCRIAALGVAMVTAGEPGLAAGSLADPPAPAGAAGALVAHYHMQPVPEEGPWFSLTYTSDDRLDGAALAPRFAGRAHAAGSAIVAVETPTYFSALHRLRSDEVWHFYAGSPLTMLLLYPDGHGQTLTLGPDVLAGEQPQVTVPHGVWQGSMPRATSAGTYTLFGTQLSPAFDVEDFEMGYRDELQRDYPAFAKDIARLTRVEFVHRPNGLPAERSSAPPGHGPDDMPPDEPPAAVFPASAVPPVTVSPGVTLQEVVGRVAHDAKSTTVSVAKFTLAPGHSSGTSFNHQSQEVFLVTDGAGEVHVAGHASHVGRDSIAFIPAGDRHSIEADQNTALSFYAISAPAFSPDDYVLVAPDR